MPSSLYRIREANPNDAPGINRVCIEAYEEFRAVIGPENWRRLRAVLARASELANEGELIVAVDDTANVLGLVLYIPPNRHLHEKDPAASIRTLSVAPTYRGKGIGRSLTQECIDRARKDGGEIINLTTAEMMKVARPMYERMGFVKDQDLGLRFGVKHARYVLRLT